MSFCCSENQYFETLTVKGHKIMYTITQNNKENMNATPCASDRWNIKCQTRKKSKLKIVQDWKSACLEAIYAVFLETPFHIIYTWYTPEPDKSCCKLNQW